MTHVVGKPAPSSQRFKQLGQYASSPGHSLTGTSCYTELKLSTLTVVIAIATTHCLPTEGRPEVGVGD